MGILDNVERGLERAVNGAFAKTFRSGLQPVELTGALRRELDTKAAVVSRDRILAPNTFSVALASSDFSRMNGMGPALTDELVEFVRTHADKQRYQFAGAVSVDLVEDPSLTTGMLQVTSQNVKGDVSWSPTVEINGVRHNLTHSRTVIGRGREADITVDDTSISRKHVEILWDGSHAQVRDLGSTNGSQLDGQPVKKAIIQPGSVITIGRTRIVFKVLPHASHHDAQPPTRRAPQTPGDDFDRFWDRP